MPGAPPSAGTTRPESSASAGRPLASAAARALSAAFASKVAPVSSGSAGRAPRRYRVDRVRPSSAAISRACRDCGVAMTSRCRRQAARHCLSRGPAPGAAAASSRRCRARASASIGANSGLGERVRPRPSPGSRRCRPAGEHEIGVGLGGRILGIVEIEHRLAGDDAARDRRDRIGRAAGAPACPAATSAVSAWCKRDIAAGDRGGARAAIGLQHVAIDADLALAQRGEIGTARRTAADQALDLLGAARSACRAPPRDRCGYGSSAAACRIPP